MSTKKSENGGFTLKTHQIFSVHTTPEERFKDTTITGHFGSVYEKNSGREITLPSCGHRPSKIGVSKFFRFEEGLPKASFS